MFFFLKKKVIYKGILTEIEVHKERSSDCIVYVYDIRIGSF